MSIKEWWLERPRFAFRISARHKDYEYIHKKYPNLFKCNATFSVNTTGIYFGEQVKRTDYSLALKASQN